MEAGHYPMNQFANPNYAMSPHHPGLERLVPKSQRTHGAPSYCGFAANHVPSTAISATSQSSNSQRLGGSLLERRRVSHAARDISLTSPTKLTAFPDRKPIDPPPIVQLRINRDADPEQSYLQSTSFLAPFSYRELTL